MTARTGSVMKRWMLVCFVTATLVTAHYHRCSTKGGIKVEGARGSNFSTVSFSLCDGREWRAVCDAGWDINDAIVVCRQLGFPTEGTQFCTDSCYGGNGFIRGATNFACTGREQRLIDCTYQNRSFGGCNSQYAGVICTRPLATPTESPPCSKATTMAPPTSTISMPGDNMPSCPETSCDCTYMPTTCPCDCTATTCNTSTTISSSDSSNTDSSMQASSLTGRSAVLGAVIAILLLTLVGVVLGWVWSCHRNRQAAKQQGGSAHNNLTNPTYDAATPSIPSVQYSSLGPRDTPTLSHIHGEEGMYHILGEAGTGEGGAYEVPVEIGRCESAGRRVEMEYSTLHH